MFETNNFFHCHRFVDPLFAIGTGLAATALKIQREQREKYPEQDNSFPALWQKALRLNRTYWGYGDEAAKK
ncbi:hypothetical protein A1O7_05256 [Cladophialophora yegresii CBS 114405]|uniref:Uncharacterized protein n=1 Tax=Cladophialophora yegresii CBS 114405 TaxID=1182544 RepID=W9VZK1_9EURO|nr:uncharacterized protein A1O7_05256 [Cladophialophora yegresii CBS 114405]EXJ61103.1 hypothetical protein A1O7_05256 [Cladophialophora yegresii CBS 114405]